MPFVIKLSAAVAKFSKYLPDLTALTKANGTIYRQMLSQAKLMSYVDVFAIFALLCFIFIPLCFMFKVSKD